MLLLDICDGPIHQMVLERALDYLVQQVRGDKFMDIGTREGGCERL
jgi:hypothetical protein